MENLSIETRKIYVFKRTVKINPLYKDSQKYLSLKLKNEKF